MGGKASSSSKEEAAGAAAMAAAAAEAERDVAEASHGVLLPASRLAQSPVRFSALVSPLMPALTIVLRSFPHDLVLLVGEYAGKKQIVPTCHLLTC